MAVWNWQQHEWPEFRWDPRRIRRAEEHFLIESGKLAGVFRHLTDEDRESVTTDSLCAEAVTTSEIEGEMLDRASVRSSIRRQLGLTSEAPRVTPAERGISELVVAVHRSFPRPLRDATLFDWHKKLFGGQNLVNEVGRYRSGDSDMEVVSGPVHARRVHFVAPPSARVPMEMQCFVDWFNRSGPGNHNALPALTRAGLAHLYFESIHPFEDGNGRIGRALVEKALAQSLGQPSLIALAATILDRRKAYYQELEAANKLMDATGWLAWFAGICLEAQRRALIQIDFLIEKTRLLDRMREHANPRQMKALLRMLREGPSGFKGGLSAGNYMAITGASSATATRDLADLTGKGALQRSGLRRHARYYLTITTQALPQAIIAEDGDIHWE